MNKKAKTMLLSLGLVGVIGTGATLAYFSDSKSVTNTFTFGNGFTTFTLDEAKVDSDTHEVVDGDRVESNTYKGILPAELLPKDPTVTFDADINSYLFVAIENPNEYLTYTVTADDWDELTEVDNKLDNVKYYVYKGTNAVNHIINKDTNSFESVVFDGVNVAEDFNPINNDSTNKQVQINVKAAAIQSDKISYDDAITEAVELLNKGLGQ